nr:IS1634 family transposase [Candidatus Sigynarchaeum springense]
MVHLIKKVKKGRVYLYLQENARINGKVKRLWQRYLGPEDEIKDLSSLARSPDIETESIEFGIETALLHIAKKLGVVDIINQHVEKRDQGMTVGEHVLLAAINRCIEPASKTQLRSWLDSTVLRDLYPGNDVTLDARSYWSHFKYLTPENIEQMGDSLVEATRTRFGVKHDMLMFDPTNFFTYINPSRPNQTLPRHGHGKDGRPTLNIVNFSLFCALDGGIPLLHLVYPGNKQDASHFKDALQRLQSHVKKIGVSPEQVTLTFDKGNLSPTTFKLIDAMKLHYIASIRPSMRKDMQFIPFTEFEMHELPNGKCIGVKSVVRSMYGKDRRMIAIYNPRQAKWQKKNLDIKISKRIAEMKAFFAKRLNTKRWNDKEKIRTKCETISGTEKFQELISVSIEGEPGKLVLSVEENRPAIEKTALSLGKSYIMTSREDMSAHDVAWAFRQQYIIEDAFKRLKNPSMLSIRPMYHWTDTSIRGHAFTCFLGLLLLSLLVRELQQLHVKTSLHMAIKHLKSMRLTRITIPGKKKTIQKVERMHPDAKIIYDALALHRFIE